MLIDYSTVLDITFLGIEKLKILYDLLYCNISFIAVVWNQTHNISELYVYIFFGWWFGEGNGTPHQYSCLENPMEGGAWWAAVHGVAKLNTTERLCFHFSLSCIGEGNGNPLQCSCLEDPRDGGAWWAAVYGVAQSQTRLK